MAENSATAATGPDSIDRRKFLKGAATTAGALALPATVFGAPTSPAFARLARSTSGGHVSFGSNYSDPATKKAFASLISAAEKATKIGVTINTVDHNTFQNDITSYLQGTPNDLFTWFAGYRVQVFAKQGLIHSIDDVWAKIGHNFSPAVKAGCKGLNGKYYIVPIYNYPWVIFYNKSTFRSKGYQIPKTWDQLIALCKQMKTDGLIPFAFGQKDGWPALGTFDIINLRLNGFKFHMQLMRHQVPWTDKRVTAVFKQWAELMPYVQAGATGRIWEDACKTLEQKQAGMIFQGTNQIAAQYVSDKADLSDLDFFVYPEINPKWGQDFMDAPMDGFCISQKTQNYSTAAKLLEYIGSGAAEKNYLKYDKWDVAVASDVHDPAYDAIQKKSVQVIKQAKNISQFMDRDSDPGFADNTVAAAVDSFINNPSSSNISSIQSSLEAQAKVVFAKA
ncbi:MAG: extracellular solute-binding protein [Conexibacteraceae bacterium]|nr:extracellular solute-binding protein [Conexibacteraceae bacterium]